MTSDEILKEHPLKLLIAAYWASPKGSAMEIICASAVYLALRAPDKKNQILLSKP